MQMHWCHFKILADELSGRVVDFATKLFFSIVF